MKIKAFGIALYKVEKTTIKILLCKSVISKIKWGFLKGQQEFNETKQQTAIREFFEECSILVDEKYLDKYFQQLNEDKDNFIQILSSFLREDPRINI